MEGPTEAVLGTVESRADNEMMRPYRIGTAQPGQPGWAPEGSRELASGPPCVR